MIRNMIHGWRAMTIVTVLWLSTGSYSRAQYDDSMGVGSALPVDGLPDHVRAPAGELSLFADYGARNAQHIVLYVVNRTDKTFGFLARNGDPLAKLEAETKPGVWERAETHAYDWSWRREPGHQLPFLRPGYFCRVLGHYPDQGQTASIRYHVYADVFVVNTDGSRQDIPRGGIVLVSNVGEGRVSPEAIAQARYDDMAAHASCDFDVLSSIALGRRSEVASDNPHLRTIAILSLRRIPEDKKADLLRTLIREEDLEIRQWSITALSDIAARCEKAARIMEDIVAAPEQLDELSYRVAVLAMGKVPFSDRTIPLLVPLFEHEDLRNSAVNAIGKIALQSPQAAAVIEELLAHDDPDVRPFAARTLEKIQNTKKRESSEVRPQGGQFPSTSTVPLPIPVKRARCRATYNKGLLGKNLALAP